MNDQVRAFVAIRLPSDLREAAAGIQEAVRRNVPGGVRWVQPHNFHLTVRFLGDLGSREIESAARVVQETRFPKMVVRLGSLSAFPSVSRPQVLWVGLDCEHDLLHRLVTDVERRLFEAGFGTADKQWKSHLTLGRISGAHGPKEWNRGISVPPEPYRLDMLSLMRSELLPDGARHTPLATVTGTE